MLESDLYGTSNRVKDAIHNILQRRIDVGADYYGGNIEPNYIPNQKRVREILEGKIAMGAGGDIYDLDDYLGSGDIYDLNSYLGSGDDDNIYQVGGYRKRRAPINYGAAGSKKGARKNPWIQYVKQFSAECGIPYNELLKVPAYKKQVVREYHKMMGSGYGTKAGARKAVKTKRKTNVLKSEARKAVRTKLKRGEIRNAPSLKSSRKRSGSKNTVKRTSRRGGSLPYIMEGRIPSVRHGGLVIGGARKGRKLGGAEKGALAALLSGLDISIK